MELGRIKCSYCTGTWAIILLYHTASDEQAHGNAERESDFEMGVAVVVVVVSMRAESDG